MLTNLRGDRLVHCVGSVRGLNPSSFRAEATGVLSALRFVTRFLEYHNLPQHKSYTHYTDSQSLLDRLNAIKKHDKYFANSTLEPDWDIVNEIMWNVNNMDHPPTLRYVASHQDKHKKRSTLPLPVQ